MPKDGCNFTLARRNHWYWMACWWKPLSHERWWKKTKDFFQQRLYHCQPSSWTLTRASRCTSRCLATLWRSKREIGFWRSIWVLASTLLSIPKVESMAFVSLFTSSQFIPTGLPWKQEHPQGLEFVPCIDFMVSRQTHTLRFKFESIF